MMIDTQAFDEAKAMMQNKFQKVIGYYLEDADNYIETIQEGLENQDAEIIIPAAHTIKSSSRQIGAFFLADYAAIIEETARECLKNKKEFRELVQKTEELIMIFK